MTPIIKDGPPHPVPPYKREGRLAARSSSLPLVGRERGGGGGRFNWSRKPASLLVLASLQLMFSLPTVQAKTLKMVCENPRREYLVTFVEGGKQILASAGDGNDGHYTVLAVEKTGNKYVVAAQTENSGPAVRAHFRPYLKMEYWTNGELFQTDACHK